MTDYVMEAAGHKPNGRGPAALKLSAQFWFLVAVIGQWVFVYYLAYPYLGLVPSERRRQSI